MSLLRFAVSFLQKRGFPLKADGSPATLAVKTWQYLLKIRVLGFVVFRCYLLCIFLGLFWSGRVCSIVGASVFAATIYRCGARHSHHCNLPDHIPSSLLSSYSFIRLIFLDPLSPSKQGGCAFIFLFGVLPRAEELLRSRS